MSYVYPQPVKISEQEILDLEEARIKTREAEIPYKFLIEQERKLKEQIINRYNLPPDRINSNGDKMAGWWLHKNEINWVIY